MVWTLVITAESLVMKTGKTRQETSVTRLISAWVWPLVLLMLLGARRVIPRAPFLVVIPLTYAHTLRHHHHHHHHHRNLKLTRKKHNHAVLNVNLNNSNK